MAAIREGVGAAESLRRFARKNLEALHVDLDRAKGGEHAAIHDVRKRLKLLRSLLRLLRPALGKHGFEHDDGALRQAHHLLAEARQAGAMNDTIKKLASFARGKKLGIDLTALPHLVETPTPEVGELGPRLTLAADKAAELLRRADRWRLPKRDVSLFVRGMRDCYAKGRKALARGFAERDIEVLHEARKAVIQLRYQLDMLSPLWPAMLRPWSKELQTLREHLGDLGDLDAFERAYEEQLASSPGLRDLIGMRREALMESAKLLADRLFAEEPSGFADRVHAIWTTGDKPARVSRARARTTEPKQPSAAVPRPDGEG